MSEKRKLLLAEDEELLGRIVKESLESRDFEVVYCRDGEQAYTQYQLTNPDLLILDVMMPYKDGFTLARQVRSHNEDIPIIFLTAKSESKDVIEGLELGADDYIKKPFSVEELILRVNSLLRRGKVVEKIEDEVTMGNYTFNIKNQFLKHSEGEVIRMTSRESELLKHLYESKNKTLDRSYVLNKLWKSDDFFAARSMDVFISKLRKKLDQDESVRIINVRGYGYKLVF